MIYSTGKSILGLRKGRKPRYDRSEMRVPQTFLPWYRGGALGRWRPFVRGWHCLVVSLILNSRKSCDLPIPALHKVQEMQARQEARVQVTRLALRYAP